MGAAFQALQTAIVFIVIIVIIVWAFWPKNKDKFERTAESIFDEDKQKDSAKRTEQESKNNE